MNNAQIKSAPLPERLCERITCRTNLNVGIAGNCSGTGARCEGVDRRHHSTPVTQNISLKNAAGHAIRKAKNSAGSAMDAIFSGYQAVIDSVCYQAYCSNKTKPLSAGAHAGRLTKQLIYGCSLALRRWRRLISPFAAVTKKPAVLSPGSLSCSISSITSCGIRTVVICDFAFFAPVAISGSPKNWCMSVYAKKMIKKDLKCISPVSKLKNKGEIHLKEQRPALFAAVTGRLTKPLNEVTIMAGTQHTETRTNCSNKFSDHCFTWRFLALSTAQPRVIHIEATSEREARQRSPQGCVMVFAARLPVQEVAHV
ncbi:ash family protein [Salmonella enterica]|nr:ash family protein [Salmonella enterica]EIQ4465902.1 host cell division inhibitor Icd-like protein [Salmonella enterica]